MEILLSLSVALFAGLMLSRLAKKVQLPAVTAYLVAGILVGPYLLGAFGINGLGFTSHENIKTYGLISDVALGFIAFSIGNEFRLSQLKQIGKKATVIGIFQAVVATLLVDAALIGLHFVMPTVLPLPSAILLGAVASATAPAATLMVVRQYKSKGPLTDILLPIVAIDDAVGLVLFAASFGVAKALLSGQIDIISVILEPVLEVVLSIGLGYLMGVLFTFFERFFHSRSKRLSMSVTFVFLTVALSMVEFKIGGVHVAFSSLLVCMMLGTVFCNLCDFSEELMKKYKTAVTVFIITALIFCSMLCLLGIFLIPAQVGVPQLPTGENISGITYGSAPSPISIKIFSPFGGALLYLGFNTLSVDVRLFEDSADLERVETDYYIKLSDGFLGRFCDRIGGLTLNLSGQRELYFGVALEQYIAEDRDLYKMREISSAFFEKISKTGLSTEDFVFIMENGETDLNFPVCYDIREYIPELFANCYYR